MVQVKLCMPVTVPPAVTVTHELQLEVHPGGWPGPGKFKFTENSAAGLPKHWHGVQVQVYRFFELEISIMIDSEAGIRVRVSQVTSYYNRD